MDSTDGTSFIIGLVLGGVIGILSTHLAITKPHINECELNLPRTQNCVLTAVPAQGE